MSFNRVSALRLNARLVRHRQMAGERNIYAARKHTPSRIFEQQTRLTDDNLTHVFIKNRVIGGAVLHWFTASNGLHHGASLCSRMPYYRLPKALRNHPALRGIGRLTRLQSMRCVRLVLWDEGERRLVSFRERRHSNEENVPGCDEWSSPSRYRSFGRAEARPIDLRGRGGLNNDFDVEVFDVVRVAKSVANARRMVQDNSPPGVAVQKSASFLTASPACRLLNQSHTKITSCATSCAHA